MGRRQHRAAGALVIVLAAAALAAGCAAPASNAPPESAPATSDPASSNPVSDPVRTGPAQPEPVPIGGACPVPPEPEREPGQPVELMTIDYVDFIAYGGRTYLADTPLDPGQVGEVVFLSGCSLSSYNAQTGQEGTPEGDGYSGFLPPGTPVHAVAGWPVECRLGAEHNGSWTLYLALDPVAEFAQPAPCAVG